MSILQIKGGKEYNTTCKLSSQYNEANYLLKKLSTSKKKTQIM